MRVPPAHGPVPRLHPQCGWDPDGPGEGPSHPGLAQPQSVKELQRFLGFANFYRRFILNFSLLSAPLTSMLRQKPKSLSWNSEARAAYKKLQEAFCTVPILSRPEPQLPFIVEVDASTTGVGAVLSQYHGEPPLLHPCAYFSRKHSPAERNYDIGNRELLAIKLALEEWRHWLEGAQHPFMVITDPKNLEYLRSAKRLNPRQARWALFFTRFQFSITYRPGDKNVKAEGKTYVPTSLRTSLLGSLHASTGSGHPGSQRTLSLLQARYWWPRMARDVSQYVRGCSVCAISKTPRHLPAGKLVPLPIPRRPWSHVRVDFVTDLPKSDGYTCILVAVDRFSKACKLIPLRGLPTALETADALFHNLRYPGRCRPRPWATVYLPCLEGFFQTPLSQSAPPQDITPRPTARLSQVKSSHLYLYSAFNNTDCVKALNSIKLEDRVSVMYNNKIKHSIFS